MTLVCPSPPLTWAVTSFIRQHTWKHLLGCAGPLISLLIPNRLPTAMWKSESLCSFVWQVPTHHCEGDGCSDVCPSTAFRNGPQSSWLPLPMKWTTTRGVHASRCYESFSLLMSWHENLHWRTGSDMRNEDRNSMHFHLYIWGIHVCPIAQGKWKCTSWQFSHLDQNHLFEAQWIAGLGQPPFVS